MSLVKSFITVICILLAGNVVGEIESVKREGRGGNVDLLSTQSLRGTKGGSLSRKLHGRNGRHGRRPRRRRRRRHRNRSNSNNNPNLLTLSNCKNKGNCGRCEGDCNNDDDCADGLSCFIRNSGTFSAKIPVPGCGNNPEEYTSKDFCYETSLAPCADEDGFRDHDDKVYRTCEWMNEYNRSMWKKRCELYGHMCRQTCDYCRTRDGNWD